MKRSFIHVADLHLGRPFSDLSLSKEISKICTNACKNAFKNIIDTAINKQVDFVLFAGDNFDSEEQDLSTKLLFIKGLKQLADNGIQSFVICGNHDPIELYKQNIGYFKFDEKYKDLIHITGVTTDEFQKTYDLGDIVIHSLSFETDSLNNPTEYLPQKIKDKFNIGLIHCELDKTTSKYAPCAREDLRKLAYDYYALGHIHLPEIIEEGMVYAGSHQGRTKKETGAHGGYFIEVEDNRLKNTKFIPFDFIRFELINMDCTETNTAEDLFNKIIQNAEDYVSGAEYTFLEINLTGISNAYEQLKDCIDLSEEFYKSTEYNNNKINIYKINNELIPNIDEEEILTDKGIIGILANSFSDNSLINIDNIYENISEIHKKIYNKLKLNDDTKNVLINSLSDDKNEIMARVQNEIKSICKEIYITEQQL